MKRLLIDANPSLGGQASLEQIGPKRRKIVTFADLVQDDTDDQEGVEDNGAQQKDGYWFLPEGAGSTETLAVSSSPSEDLPQRSDSNGAVDAPISISSQSPNGSMTPNTENTRIVDTPGDTGNEHSVDASSRPTKVSRELKRLRIDANPSLSFVDLASPEPTLSTRFTGKQPAHDPREVSDSQETRAGDSSPDPYIYLEDRTAGFEEFVRVRGERAAQQAAQQAAQSRAPFQRLGDLHAPSSSKSASKPPRRPRKNPHPQRWPRPAKVFPDPCPEELADQILRIFGEAAGDAPLLRALEGTAQDSIAREVRHEAPAEYSERARKEIACLETFDPAKGILWEDHFLAGMGMKVPLSDADIRAEFRAEQTRKRAERAERRSSTKVPVATEGESSHAQHESADDMAQTTVLDDEELEEIARQKFLEVLSPDQRDYYEWYMSLPVMTEEEQAQFRAQNEEAEKAAEDQRRLELQMAGDPEWQREQEEKKRRSNEETARLFAHCRQDLEEMLQRQQQEQR